MHCHIPPVTLSFLSFFLFFFSFFSTFLSFSLLLYLFFFLFFFKAKSSYSPTAHTHSVLFAFFRFSVLSFLFFLFFSHRSLTRQPKPRDHRRRSSITRRKAPPHTHSPHHYYRTCSSIWLEHRNRHLQQRRISVGNNWKRFDLEALLSTSGTTPLEARFLSGSFFFFFFFSWCTINKYEWSFEFGVMSCFRWC